MAVHLLEAGRGIEYAADHLGHKNIIATIGVTNLNEWELGGKGGFVQRWWSRLHPRGCL
jgi:hypothetical protein